MKNAHLYFKLLEQSVAAAFSGSVFVFDIEVSLSILCVKVQTCEQCLTIN